MPFKIKWSGVTALSLGCGIWPFLNVSDTPFESEGLTTDRDYELKWKVRLTRLERVNLIVFCYRFSLSATTAIVVSVVFIVLICIGLYIGLFLYRYGVFFSILYGDVFLYWKDPDPVTMIVFEPIDVLLKRRYLQFISKKKFFSLHCSFSKWKYLRDLCNHKFKSNN